jgi:hypothetical protein
LSTAPIRVSDIVLGKFYALATLLFIPVAIISIYPLVLSAFGEISLAETYLAVGAFFLYGLACITIGEFVSSITESQMIAAIISFGILFAGYVMNAMPKLYMVTGHGELELDSAFTGILQKANIDTQTVNLMDYDAVPEDAMAVFVNAPTEDLSSDDAQKILNYLNNGGDIFINTAYTGKDMPNLNKLLDFYGVITEAAAEDDTEDTTEDTARGTGGENAETIRQVNQDTVSAYLDDICAFTAKQEITDVTDYSDYGISDESDTVTLQLANDLYVFRIGDYNSLAGGYYLTVNDGSSVYLIDSSTYYLLHKDSSCFEVADEEESTEAADQE